MQTVWDTLNVSLPEILYENQTAAGQGKGSTEWAAHSHTPISVVEWTGFDNLVAAEGNRHRNRRLVNFNLKTRFEMDVEALLPCSREEQVTTATALFLSKLSIPRYDLVDGVCFPERNSELTAKPDIIAMKKDDTGLGVGSSEEYASPQPGKKAQTRRENVQLIKSLYMFPFETKPNWKFRFLKLGDVDGTNSRTEAHNIIINHWEVPQDFDAEKMQAEVPLPASWSGEKKKVFHLVRQIYGQMVADNCRYGVFHTYDRWIFCKRSSDGTLSLSRAFRREETSPSVLHAIKTLTGFEDYFLPATAGSGIHPSSASKAPAKKKAKLEPKPPPLPPSYEDDRGGGAGGDRKPTERGKGKNNRLVANEIQNLAATLSSCECDVFDKTDKVLLLTTPKYPSVLVKMQQDPSLHHVAQEMAHEAEFYAALQGLQEVEKVIPKFYGHSTHLGVAMSCFEREMDDFDDIAIENLPMELKRSAVSAVEVLSNAGILHNDLELHNIVQCKSDPTKAKIIDFGRAEFSDNENLLAKQVQRVNVLLGLGEQTGQT